MSAPNIAEISKHAAIDDRRRVIDQLRDDFKAVFAHWRRMGELSDAECRQQMQESGEAISKMDVSMTAKTAQYFAGLAKRIRDDESRSRAIAETEKQDASKRRTRR